MLTCAAISVHIMNLMLFHCAATYLLVALLLMNCLRANTISEDAEVLMNNTTRPEVRISHGTVRGIHMVTHRGRKIFGFRSIPFAQPPVGSLRFQAPLPAEPWNITLDAGKESSPCPYATGSTVLGNEDCLYLRVYTPRLPESQNTALLPVIVYIYGGGFNVGTANSSRYGPYFLLDKDVILVVPSYRLSVLGFLSTGDEISPGNNGLKDLVQALKWNQDNIQYFGGDPDRVTLAGGSSGAMSAELLGLSNLTKGLFHRLITQSGSALATDAQRSKSRYPNRAIQLGEYLGCPTNTSSVLVKCLRGIDASKLVSADKIFHVWEELPMNSWGPSPEPDIEGALFTDIPENLLDAETSHDLPRLALITPQEGVYYHALFYKNPEILQDFLNKVDIILPAQLKYNDMIEDVTRYTAALKSYYLNDLNADKNLLINNITQLMGDAMFAYPLYRSMQLHRYHKKSPQYLCMFQYQGTLSHSYGLTQATVDWGTVHGDETLYLFESPSGLYGPPDWKMSETDWQMVDLMVHLWTSFASNGILTSPNSNGTAIAKPYSSRKNHLQIGSNSEVSLSVGYDFLGDRAEFWDELVANVTWV